MKKLLIPINKSTWTAVIVATGTALGACTLYQSVMAPPAFAAETAASSVFRITAYPSDANFYEVVNGNLYHVLGTPDHRQASFYVGSAPAFLKEGQIYVRDAQHQFYLRGDDGDHYIGIYVPPYENLDLRLPSAVQASDIDQFIQSNYANSPLIGLGKTFIDAQKRYGVNAVYLASHAILESGWGFSSIAQDKHNLFGYMAYDSDPYGSAAYFSSYEAAIEYQAYFVATQYLDPNGQWYGGSSNLDGMNVHYATDPYWAEKISGIMNRMHPYSASEYAGKSPLSVNAAPPEGPTTMPLDTILSTTYPANTQGVTLSDVNFRSGPSTSTEKYGVLPAGTKITVLGKNKNNWYQVRTGQQTGWVFGDYLQLVAADSDTQGNSASTGGTSSDSTASSGNRSDHNNSTGQTLTSFPAGTRGVTTDTVNFRAEPSLQADKYGVLQTGTPLLLLKKDSNNWYQVNVNNRTGWVYGDYVKILDASSSQPTAGTGTSGSTGTSATGSHSQTPQASLPTSDPLTVYVNGKKQSYDPAPMLVNNRAIVPLRALFETLGAKVNWDDKTRTATASKGNVTISLQLDVAKATVNGKTVKLDAAPQVVQGRIMVPVRFVSETLGAQVVWDNATRSIKITKKDG